MTGVTVSMIFVGAIILGFSFVLKAGKKNLDRDFEEAIKNFEKQKKMEEQEEFNAFEECLGASENNIENNSEENSENEYNPDLSDEYDNDDEDFAALMKQARAFLRLVGIALIVIGIISFFL